MPQGRAVPSASRVRLPPPGVIADNAPLVCPYIVVWFTESGWNCETEPVLLLVKLIKHSPYAATLPAWSGTHFQPSVWPELTFGQVATTAPLAVEFTVGITSSGLPVFHCTTTRPGL